MVNGVNTLTSGKMRPRGVRKGLAEIQAVAFDAYGTLFAFNDADFVATMARICEIQGLLADGAEVWKRFLRSAIAFQRKRAMNGASPADGVAYWRYGDTWPLHFADVFRQLRLDGDPQSASEFLRATLAQAPAYSDAAEVVESVRQAYPVALLSNADDNFLLPCLAYNGLHFETVITSESVMAMKPDPTIFRRLSESIDVEPASILYVGDNPIADVLGARLSGLQVAWINRFSLRKPRRAPHPDIRLRSLSDLLPALHVQ